MGTLVQDLRCGLRMLAKNPGFTAVAVLTLALGIGVDTAVFTAAEAALPRSWPVKSPERPETPFSEEPTTMATCLWPQLSPRGHGNARWVWSNSRNLPACKASR